MPNTWGMPGIVLVCLIATGCRSKAEKEAYEAKKKAFAAEADKKEAEEKAKRDAAEASLRAACRDKNVKLPSDHDVIRWCKDEARSNALNPGDVSFPFFRGPAPVGNGCMVVYLSSLTTTNGFGAKVERSFRCEVNPKTERATVKF